MTVEAADGGFTVEDDQLMRTALEGGASLAGLAAGAVKFSKQFTEDQLTDRWRSLLYQPSISRPAAIAMAQAGAAVSTPPVGTAIPPRELVKGFRARTTDQPSEADVAAAQARHEDCGAAGPSADPEDVALPTFSEAEEAILDLGMDAPLGEEWSDKQLRRRRRSARAKQLRELQRLEGRSRAGTDRLMSSQGAVAMVLGLRQRYYLRKNEVIVGRSTDDVKVDVDLSLAGNASKVSRQQAFIQRTAEGHFYLRNIGRRPVIVNNCAVEKGMRVRMPEDAYLEVGGIRMMFLPNRSLFPSSHADAERPAAAAPPPPMRRRTPSLYGELSSPRLASPPPLSAMQVAALDAAEAALRPHLPEAQASSDNLALQGRDAAAGAEESVGGGKPEEGATAAAAAEGVVVISAAAAAVAMDTS